MPETWTPTDRELAALLEDIGGSLAVPAGAGLPALVRERIVAEPEGVVPLRRLADAQAPANFRAGPPDPGCPAREKDTALPASRAWRRAVVAAAAVVAVLAATLVASPATREAVADWLGIGAVEIELSDRRPPAETVAALDLGQEVTVAEASRRAGVPVRWPASLGSPAAVYTRTIGPVREVTLVWPPGQSLPATPAPGVGLLLTELRGGVHPAIVKQVVAAATQIRPVAVNGGEGWWISGAPHTVTYLTPGGREVSTATRLAGNVLLWERAGITYRLESALGLADALRLAADVR
ncbi:MAG: hypothetical protein ACRD0N_02450 [Acidimicrobiales bacterium]